MLASNSPTQLLLLLLLCSSIALGQTSAPSATAPIISGEAAQQLALHKVPPRKTQKNSTSREQSSSTPSSVKPASSKTSP